MFCVIDDGFDFESFISWFLAPRTRCAGWARHTGGMNDQTCRAPSSLSGTR